MSDPQAGSDLDDLFTDVVVNSVDDLRGEIQQESEDEVAAVTAMILEQVEADCQRDGLLFFDLETVPDETRFPRPIVPEPTPLAFDIGPWLADKKTTVDVVKEVLGTTIPPEQIDEIERLEKTVGKSRKGILDACEQARSGGNAAMQEWKKYSLNPFKARIVALGWAVGLSGQINSIVATDAVQERALLTAWWNLFAQPKRKHCGFNQVAFDVPMIGIRSVMLGVRPTRILDRRKYNNHQAIDVMTMIDAPGTCKEICRAIGVKIPSDESPNLPPDMDGSKVLDLWDDGRFDEIGEYVRSDVYIEREAYIRFADVFGS